MANKRIDIYVGLGNKDTGKTEDKEAGAEFILEVAKNNAGLVLPGCQPVYNPMFGQWLHKKDKMFEDLKKKIVLKAL